MIGRVSDRSPSGRREPATAPKRDGRVRMTGKERREQLLDIGRVAVRREGLRRHLGRGDRGQRPGSPSRWSTSTSAARKASTRSWSTARCSALLDDDHRRADQQRPPARAARAGGAGAARLHRGVHRRVPHPGARLAGRLSHRHVRQRCISDIASQVEHILATSSRPRLRPEARADVRADARRHGRADRPVVAGRAQAQARRRSPRTWSTWPGTACPASRPSPGYSGTRPTAAKP